MIYWTTYNFSGYLLFKLNYLPMNSVLKTSILCTSLVGGFMVYIYPRKMILTYRKKKYKIPYPLLAAGDLLIHQYPLYDTFLVPTQIHICGAYLIPSMFFWYSINKLMVKDTKKIYGIPLEKLLVATLSIISGVGMFHHYYLKK